MIELDPRDDGHRIVRQSDGRMLASLECVQVSSVAELVNGQAVAKQKLTPLPRDKWMLHFSGVKTTPAEVAAVLAEIDKLK